MANFCALNPQISQMNADFSFQFISAQSADKINPLFVKRSNRSGDETDRRQPGEMKKPERFSRSGFVLLKIELDTPTKAREMP
jgi:hypothetical protein